MKHLLSKQTLVPILSLLGTIFFSMSVLSEEAVIKSNLETMSKSNLELMDESDLGGVSALAGNNVLSIFGAPAAGLSIDVDGDAYQASSTSLATKKYQESETTNDTARNEIRTIEENDSTNVNTLTVFRIDETAYNQAIHDAEEVTVESNFQSTSTSSEVLYKESNVSHKMTPISNNSISMQTDVFIDQFRFESLKGNDDNRPDAGQLYLSDFQITTQTYTTAK